MNNHTPIRLRIAGRVIPANYEPSYKVVFVIIPPHTRAIDPELWPSVAAIPSAAGMSTRSRLAEAGFARATAKAGLVLSATEGETPDLVVLHEELFDRLAQGGWVGLAESYLADEWRTESPHTLAEVLKALIQENYRPRTPRVRYEKEYTGGEIPPELVERYSGDGMSAFAGRFATGIPTTERESVRSFAPRARKGHEPTSHFVNVTEVSAPLSVDRADLGDAQARSVSTLLDAAGVAAGSHVLAYPSAGGAIAVETARRHATVDAVTADPSLAAALKERMTFAGVGDAVHTTLIDAPTFHPGRWNGSYDAVLSIEKFETLPADQRGGYLAAIGQLLAPGGKAAVQSLVATPKMNAAARLAVESLRAYVWPALSYPTIKDVYKLVDKETSMRVVAVTHAPEHLVLSLKLQRGLFVGQQREAAADGFDAVYRRLWIWQLALREALASLGMIDVAQFTMTHRNRQGLR